MSGAPPPAASRRGSVARGENETYAIPVSPSGTALYRRADSTASLELSSDHDETPLIGALEIQQPPRDPSKREAYPDWLFDHPKGLYVLAATEVWERFGFYGMRSLLILYMTQDLFLAENRDSVWGLRAFSGKMPTGAEEAAAAQVLASRIYGMYTCTAYLTTLGGGLLADQYLGRRRTVMLGAALMSFGYFLLGSFPHAFLPALATIAVGQGCLKPNVSSQIGAMYDSWDTRKNAAFLIFYCAINLGAFISPIVSGILHATMGFGAGFLASSLAVLGGLIQYYLGLGHLPKDCLEEADTKCSLSDDGKDAADEPMQSSNNFFQLLYKHRTRLVAIIGVCFLTIGFWGVYEQQGNTLPLFADQDVAMHIGGTRVPTEFVQSINPLLIMGFTPLVSAVWKWQAGKGAEPASLTKMAIGCLLLSLGYTWLTAAVSFAVPGEKVGLGHLAAGIALATIGELYVAPVGLAFVSETAPEELTAFVMGMWFVAGSMGYYVCGALGTMYSQFSRAGFFSMLAMLAAANGVVLFAVKGVLQRAISGS